MSFVRLRVRLRMILVLFSWFLLCSASLGTSAVAAEKATESTGQKDAPSSKESFNLIIPYKDLTVGQGQEVTMDTEVVNRTKNPVEVNLSLESIPKGWEANFNSRYPSYPVRSVTVQGEKSTTIEFKSKVPQNTKPGNYDIKVIAKLGIIHYIERRLDAL